MVMTLDDKKAVVAEVSDVANSALSAAAADYRGLTVSEMNELRSRARNSGVYLKIVRNTLVRRALEGTEFECMNDSVLGPLVYAFSKDSPGDAAKLFHKFIKDTKKLDVKVLAMSGKVLDVSQLETLSKLPNKEEAISMLMSVMKAPISKFVRTVAEPKAKMVRTIMAVRDAK